MAKKMTAAQLKKELQPLMKNELTELVLQLYKSSPEAVDFLNVRMGGKAYAESLLHEAKEGIDKIFFPRRRTKRFSVQDAKKIVTDFSNVCQDSTMVMDLELYFTEQAVEFENRYTGMKDSFYTTTESMFQSFVRRLNETEDETAFEALKSRIDKMLINSVGTGFRKSLETEYNELKWLQGKGETTSEETISFGMPYETEPGEVLPEEDGKLFYKLWWPLLDFTNKKHHLFDIDPIISGSLDLNEAKQLTDILWETPALIDEYLALHADDLPADHRAIISGWKHAKRGRFILERHLKKGSIFIFSDNSVYQVRGITSSWEEMFYGWHLPAYLEMTLLPFRNVIISDGLVCPMPVYIGSGIAKTCKETYMAAKRRKEIITNLQEA